MFILKTIVILISQKRTFTLEKRMYKLIMNTRINKDRALARPVITYYATKLPVNNGYQIEIKKIIVICTLCW